MLLPPRLLALFTAGIALVITIGSVAPAGTESLAVGVNCSKNPISDTESCRRAGTKLGRVEWDINSSPSNMESLYAAFVAKGIKVQPLAGFHARVPTAQEAQNLRNWALRFGPGGTFWQGRSDGHLAVTHIEFGNETSYSYQYGESGSWWASSSYTTRARTYAQRVKEASLALQGTGVGLLVQAEDGGSGSSSWVDNMVAAVPDLSRYVAGWTVHPYGPGGFGKIDRMLSHLQAKGLPSTIPFYITEWGVSTDNGRTLSQNFGYPTNMTYADAAATVRDTFARWRSSYGSRLAQVIIYQNADLASPGTSSDYYMYFGIFRKDGLEKGAYAAEVRAQISGSTTSTSNQVPVARVSATPTSGVAPLTVSFSSAGSADPDGSISAYAWDLDGDGQFDDSTVQSPTHAYASAGNHSARLRVTDNAGAHAISSSLAITVHADSPPGSNTGLEEKALGRATSASSSENAPWALPKNANDGAMNTRWSSAFRDNEWWQVDLGSRRSVSSVAVAFNQWAWPRTYRISTSPDGTSWATAADGSLSGPGTATTTFVTRLARYVRITGLTRGTPNGTSIEEAKVYGSADTVTPPPTPANQPPVAKASASTTSGQVPLAVSFSSAGSSDPDGSIAAYAWDLDGDGQFDDATGQSASHTYASTGSYAVKLRVTDNEGAQAISAAVAIVAAPATSANQPPVAKASASTTSGKVPLAVSFSSAGSSDPDGSIAAYAWDLDGDGQFDDATGQSASHTYASTGSYAVKLRVTDNEGAQAISAAVAIVAAPATSANQPPVAKASASTTSGKVPLAVSFSSAGSSDPDGSIAAYAWDLDGDGQFDDATGQSASHTYASTGSYAVKLRVTDNEGAQAISAAVAIVAAPAPAQPPAPEDVDVYLLSIGKYEARVIQVVRDALKITQNEAKDLVVQGPAPFCLKRSMPRADAEKLKAALEYLGATVELR